MRTDTEIVVVGGGDNGLIAAASLARAGKRVVLLERADAVGGVTASQPGVEGVDTARLSETVGGHRLPSSVIDDLGLDLTASTRSQRVYAPLPFDPRVGLVIDPGDHRRTRESFGRIGAEHDASRFERFTELCSLVAATIRPTLTGPLLRRDELGELIGRASPQAGDLWNSMTTVPLRHLIEQTCQSDLARGVMLSKALPPTPLPSTPGDRMPGDQTPHGDDALLSDNIRLLTHLLNDETADTRGGTAATITQELARAAEKAGVQVVTSAEVTAIDASGDAGNLVDYTLGTTSHTIATAWVIAGVDPDELALLLGNRSSGGGAPGEPSFGPFEARPFGDPDWSRVRRERSRTAHLTVTMLLSRLPRLHDALVTPDEAFGSGVHVNQTASLLHSASVTAAGGGIPDPLPVRVFSPSVVDPRVLSPAPRAAGAHVLTVTAVHMPQQLLDQRDSPETAHRLKQTVISSLESVFAEPVGSLLMTTVEGPCIASALVDGGPARMSWPFASDDARVDSPPERWGVATGHPRVLLCAAGAVRGGIRGIGGRDAAMAVLEAEGRWPSGRQADTPTAWS
ncbi:NAD(P)/FAD-dependent oxidoreductase [Okibacterium endophyticum]